MVLLPGSSVRYIQREPGGRPVPGRDRQPVHHRLVYAQCRYADLARVNRWQDVRDLGRIEPYRGLVLYERALPGVRTGQPKEKRLGILAMGDEGHAQKDSDGQAGTR